MTEFRGFPNLHPKVEVKSRAATYKYTYDRTRTDKKAGEDVTKNSRNAGRERGLGDRRRWLALLLVCAAQLVIVLDGTIVNVALPAI